MNPYPHAATSVHLRGDAVVNRRVNHDRKAWISIAAPARVETALWLDGSGAAVESNVASSTTVFMSEREARALAHEILAALDAPKLAGAA